jgi:hypothetical protein
MASHSLTHEQRPRPARTNGLLHLGAPQFWLLSAILGSILGLVALIFLAYQRLP